MKKILLLLLIPFLNFSQVGIGTSTPNSSAILDVTSTNKGILIPRVSLNNVTDSTTPINSPATGLLVWNTNATVTGGSGIGFYYYTGSQWTPITVGKNTLDQAYDQGGAGLGRTIIADANAVRINGTDGILVTGTFGSGATTEISGAGTRMFFNPRKSAFRSGTVTGTQWDNANIGNYSFATGLDTRATGNRSFAANFESLASGEDAAAFGKTTIASGIASAAFGNGSTATGNFSFAGGTTSIASGVNSFAFGNVVEAPSFAEIALGQFNTTYTPASATTFNSSDRIFSIGIGTGSTTKKDALEVFKDGRVRINNSYTLPTTDGTSNQVLTTNGAGIVSWSSGNSPIVSHTLYAADTQTTESNAAFTQVQGALAACVPSLYNASGNIQMKVIIRYSNKVGGGTNQFQLRSIGTTTNVRIAETDTWTDTNTGGTTGVIESQWKNWSSATEAAYYLQLRHQNTTGGSSITISNVYVLIKSQ